MKAIDADERPPLDEMSWEGARRMLPQATEVGVAVYIDQHQEEVDAQGHRLVVRNGRGQERTLVTRRDRCGCGRHG